MLTSFKYLGIVLSAADDDWPEVVRNLVKALTVWQSISRILSREGSTLRVSGFFFKSVVQSGLLFSEDNWVVTPPHGKFPGGLPVPGVEATDRGAPTAEAVWKVEVHLCRGGESGGGV